MADDGDEVGDQIEGHSQIGKRGAEQKLGAARTARMPEDEAIDPNLAPKASTYVFKPVGESHQSAFPTGGSSSGSAPPGASTSYRNGVSLKGSHDAKVPPMGVGEQSQPIEPQSQGKAHARVFEVGVSPPTG